jgi:protein-tyrosine phosphatase
MKEAFRYKQISVFGGKADNVAINCPFDLIINLSGQKLFDDIATHNVKLPELEKALALSNNAPRLVIGWADFSAPSIPRFVWESIVKDIKAKAKGKSNFRLAVCCVGGTGRTGTCLAILKALLTKAESDPIRDIRANYKFDAVETYGQIQYVEDITGIKSRCKPVPKTTTKAATKAGTCNSMGRACNYQGANHTETCDWLYQNGKTETKAEALLAQLTDTTLPVVTTPVVTTPVVKPACNGKGKGCSSNAPTHSETCTEAYLAGYSSDTDSACDGSGKACPEARKSANFHSLICLKKKGNK